METTRNFDELRQQVETLDLEVKKVYSKSGKEITGRKGPYIEALRDHYIKQEFGDNVPKHLQNLLSIESFCLCKRIQELKPEVQEAIWNDSEYIAEVKEDGVRIMIVHVPGEGFHFYSRNLSVTDFRPSDYAHIVDYVYNGNSEYLGDFMLDCELVSNNPNVRSVLEKKGMVTETVLQAVMALITTDDVVASKKIQRDEAPLQFKSFDCLRCDGQWVLDRPLRERKIHTIEIIKKLQAGGFNIVPTLTNQSNKRVFFEQIVHDGGEGVILKNLNEPYNATSSRAKGWIKAKRSVSLSGDTDVFVTGHVEADQDSRLKGMVAGVSLSVFIEETGESHEIANISGFPDDVRKDMTEIGPDGKPRLAQKYYGRVCTIDGQSISARAKRFRHARFVQWRPDKSPNECVMSQKFLDSLIL